MPKVPVLLFDDDEIYKGRLINFLKDRGCQLDIVDSAAAVMEELRRNKHAFVVLSDLMPGARLKDFSRAVADIQQLPPLFFIAQGLTSAIAADLFPQAPEHAVFDRPLKMDTHKGKLEQLIGTGASQENKQGEFDIRDLLRGEHPRMLSLFSAIKKVASTDSTVLVTGESGTGKELVARAIHQYSPRRRQPLVAVNCGAIPETLLESELFGHVKGAFTGAVSSRDGRFLQADKGTIFLDEIGEMSLPMQVKLLRILQERQLEPVGGSASIAVDVRVIAATNRDLEQCVESNTFRKDLYYRLNVVPVEIPSLRERIADLDVLVQHFLSIFCAKNKRNIDGLSPGAMAVLRGYSWPGNVRELEHLIERVTILKGDGTIDVEDLPDKIRYPSLKPGSSATMVLPEAGIDLNELLDQVENALILQALNRTSGNKQKAADLLRLNRTTLVEKLKKKRLEGDS